MQQQTLKLNEICEIITSPVDKKSYKNETPVLLCNYTDVYYNEFITKNINFMEATASDNEIKKYSLYKGDVVITKDSETPDDIGISTYIAEDIENLVCGYHLAILRPNTKYVNGLYLAYYLKLQQVLNIFSRFANGITRYSLINATYKAVPVLLPPLAEQEKIAEILSLWDKAIEHTKELIAYKEKQKKGLMQNLLTGKKRLHGFNDDWETLDINDCFYHFGGTALEKYMDNAGEYKFISIGNYSTDGKYIDNGNRIILNNITKMKLLNKNELVMVLNDKTSDGKIIGACILIDKDNTYIYNQRSEKLVCKQNILPLYAWFLLNSNYFRKKIFSKAQGGTQIYINFSSIIDIKIFLPPLNEQKAIADILCKADEEIELLNKQLDLYTEQEKGLMQNLLTGKVRVKV